MRFGPPRPPAAMRRCAARLLAAAGLAPLLVVTGVRVAAAAPAPGPTGGSGGPGPAAVSWIGLADSRGIPLWNYGLSLDRGGITSPDKFFWSAITDLCWETYRSTTAVALWFMDWVLGFDWLATLAAPLLATGEAMQSVVDRVGAVPVLLTVTAVVAVAWMARGRYAAGIWELGIALVIAVLATGVFAQPVQLVAGEDGLIVSAERAGLELSAALADGGDPGGRPVERLRAEQTGRLVDTFIRQPAEMINFGRVLDGGPCETAYDDAVRAGPVDSVRERVGRCDSALGDYAAQPSAAMAVGAVAVMPASLAVLLLVVVMAGAVLVAACTAMFQAAKAIVTLVTGLLPGAGRGSLMLTAAETVVSLLVVLFTTVFLGVFLQVVLALFRSGSRSGSARTFLIVDIVLVVGVVIYRRQRRRIAESAQRLARWMAQRPGDRQATRLPERRGAGLGAAAAGAATTAARLAAWRATRSLAHQAAADRAQRAAEQRAGAQRATAQRAAQPTAGGGRVRDGQVEAPDRVDLSRQAAAGPGARAHGWQPRGQLTRAAGGRPRVPGPRTRMGAGLARAGAHAALAYATGGASTVVAGSMTAAKAGTAVVTARRVALGSRLALPAARTGSLGPAAAPPAHGGPPPRSGRGSPQPPMPARTKPALPVARPARAPRRPAEGTPPAPASASSRGGAADAHTGDPAAPTGPDQHPATPSLPPHPRPRSRGGPGQPPAGPRRQWDKVVRDGAVVLVPKAPAEPEATSRALALVRARRRAARGR